MHAQTAPPHLYLNASAVVGSAATPVLTVLPTEEMRSAKKPAAFDRTASAVLNSVEAPADVDAVPPDSTSRPPAAPPS
jgi:hypothetical protein